MPMYPEIKQACSCALIVIQDFWDTSWIYVCSALSSVFRGSSKGKRISQMLSVINIYKARYLRFLPNDVSSYDIGLHRSRSVLCVFCVAAFPQWLFISLGESMVLRYKDKDKVVSKSNRKVFCHCIVDQLCYLSLYRGPAVAWICPLRPIKLW